MSEVPLHKLLVALSSRKICFHFMFWQRILPHKSLHVTIKTHLCSASHHQEMKGKWISLDATLETTLGKLALPKSGHPLECYLNQVAFPES